jgi:hypothetical protein
MKEHRTNRPRALTGALATVALVVLPSACKRVGEPTGGGTNVARAAQVASAPTLPTKESLLAIWGASRDDVWAVGDKGIILHFDGKAWKVSNSGTIKNLTGVHGTGQADVWAVGDGGITLHFDGNKWTEMVKAVDRAETTLLAVRAVGPKDVWTSGTDDDSGYLRHHTGDKWEDAHVGATSLWEIWASSPTDVWMVGSDKTGGGFVLKGDGKKFDRPPFEGTALRGVWGAGKDDVWVATYKGDLHHWDGKAWSKSNAPNSHELLGLSGSSATDVWAVGYEGTVLHYDGHAWSPRSVPAKVYLWSVWASAPDNAWVAGTEATLLRWDGHAWGK